MKNSSTFFECQIVRPKPGRFLRLSPKCMRKAGWCVGDRLKMHLNQGRILIDVIPEARAWRIARLRVRSHSTGDVSGMSCAGETIRTFREYLELCSSSFLVSRYRVSQLQSKKLLLDTGETSPDRFSREELQARWMAMESEKEKWFSDLAGYLERENNDLIEELSEVLGDDTTPLSIARCIDCTLFQMGGDAWRVDLRRRIMAAVFGHCA